MVEKRPGSYLHVWLAAVGLLLVLAVILLLAPFRTCPDCEGTSKPFYLQLDVEADFCKRCEGKSQISLYRKWTTRPQGVLVGAVQIAEWRSHVMARMAQERIWVRPSSIHLGVLEFHADSSQDARRAREILSRDADEKNYRFWCPGRPNPWAAK